MTLRKLKPGSPLDIVLEALDADRIRIEVTEGNTGRKLLTRCTVERNGPLRGISLKIIADGLLVEWL